jgi:tRNA(Ile)-lysidine synthase
MTAMNRPLAARFAAHLAESALLPPGAPVAVALSGGLDSQVLLHLLRFAAAPPGELLALHYDHRMRDASAADAAWVAGLCTAWQVRLVSGVANRPLRSETDARAARYAFFESALAERPGVRVATAHHLDDQAETILFRLMRGSGLTGLRGIAPRRARYVRPLLPFARAELDAYARLHDIRGRPDATNAELNRPRNAIRHLVLPHLERTRPGARAAVLRLSEAAAETEARFAPLLDEAERLAARTRPDGAILLATAIVRAYHPGIRGLLLRRLLGRLGSAPGRMGTRAAMQFISTGRIGGRIDLPGGVQLERGYDQHVLRRTAAALPGDRSIAIPGPEFGSGTARIGGRRLVVRWRTSTDADGGHAHATRVDPGAVRFPLELRGWRAGDRIRLAYGTKKLKKLFGELRLDQQARSRTPVLAEGRDRILWIVGHVRSVDALPGTEPALHITVMDG